MITKVFDPETGRIFSEDELAWISGHMRDLRRIVAERRIQRQTLWSGLAIGLAVHVAGFLLTSSAAGEPIGALADLLYTLGWALWTGVVVVAVVEIIPAAKERQISQYLAFYEAALRSRARPEVEEREEHFHTTSTLGGSLHAPHSRPLRVQWPLVAPSAAAAWSCVRGTRCVLDPKWSGLSVLVGCGSRGPESLGAGRCAATIRRVGRGDLGIRRSCAGVLMGQHVRRLGALIALPVFAGMSAVTLALLVPTIACSCSWRTRPS
jgi:hypothetical protein